MSVYIDSGSEDYSVEAASSKVFAGEALQRSAYEALRIAAGSGFVRDNPNEQITRDYPIPAIRGNQRGIAAVYSPVGSQNIYSHAATFGRTGGY